MRDWFPNLVSYQTFNYRLNRMAGAVRELSSQLLRMFRPSDCQDDTVIVDSMPIITCCGRNRTGKVARDIADKGYCSTKNLYYHGLKLHMVGYLVSEDLLVEKIRHAFALEDLQVILGGRRERYLARMTFILKIGRAHV